MPSAAVGSSEEAVIAALDDDLRVRADDRQWILEYRQSGGKTWKSVSFTATKEALILRIKDHLLERHLTRLGCYEPKRVQVADAKTGKLKWRKIVTAEALAITETARTALKRDDMAVFGIDPAAWNIILQLPNCFRNDHAAGSSG